MTKPLSPHVFDAVLRQDFPSFVRKCFETLCPGQIFLDNWHIWAITYHLALVDAGQITRLAIALPPRSLKSIITSIAYPAWRLGQDPSARIICVSYSSKLAEPLARDVRTVVNSDWYQRAFPGMRIQKDTADELVTTKGGYRLATSTRGTLTGRGGSLIIIDDPLSADEASSAAEREAANEFYRSTILTRLDNKLTGAIILVMQRLHDQDLFGVVRREGGYTELVLPAIAPCDQEVPIGPGLTHARTAGEVLDPQREPLEILERLRRGKGSAAFQAQYLQAPVPEGGHMVHKAWLKTYDRSPLPLQPGDLVAQSWDTAMKGGAQHDHSVCTTWLWRGTDHYLLDVWRQQVDYPTLLRRAREEHHKHRPDTVLIEDTGSGTALIQDLKHHHRIACKEIKADKDKVTRLSNVLPLIENGTVHLPQDAPWLGEFVDELLRFPQARFDDQVDSLSQYLNWVRGRQRTSIFEVDWGWDDLPGSPDPDLLAYLVPRY